MRQISNMICFDNLAQIEIIDDEPLREVIETLGGWPVATPGWDENNESVPSLEKLLAMLKRKFTLGVLLEEWIGPDDKHSEDNVIQVYINEIARQNCSILSIFFRHNCNLQIKTQISNYR